VYILWQRNMDGLVAERITNLCKSVIGNIIQAKSGRSFMLIKYVPGSLEFGRKDRSSLVMSNHTPDSGDDFWVVYEYV